MFEDLAEVKTLMADKSKMEGRRLLVRLHDDEVAPLRANGLYVATATIKKWAKTSSWADIEYVKHPETSRLHLAPKFHQKDCAPEKFVQKSNSFWHCGWAVYRKDAADIGEDWQELFAAASSLQAVGAREKAAMAASEHALTAAMAASAKRARETAATAASAKRARGTAATVASAK
jgi:hypothetical protein